MPEANHTRIVDNSVGGVIIDKDGKPRIGCRDCNRIVFVRCSPADVDVFEVYAKPMRQTCNSWNARGKGPRPARIAVVIMGTGK